MPDTGDTSGIPADESPDSDVVAVPSSSAPVPTPTQIYAGYAAAETGGSKDPYSAVNYGTTDSQGNPSSHATGVGQWQPKTANNIVNNAPPGTFSDEDIAGLKFDPNDPSSKQGYIDYLTAHHELQDKLGTEEARQQIERGLTPLQMAAEHRTGNKDAALDPAYESAFLKGAGLANTSTNPSTEKNPYPVGSPEYYNFSPAGVASAKDQTPGLIQSFLNADISPEHFEATHAPSSSAATPSVSSGTLSGPDDLSFLKNLPPPTEQPWDAEQRIQDQVNAGEALPPEGEEKPLATDASSGNFVNQYAPSTEPAPAATPEQQAQQVVNQKRSEIAATAAPYDQKAGDLQAAGAASDADDKTRLASEMADFKSKMGSSIDGTGMLGQLAAINQATYDPNRRYKSFPKFDPSAGPVDPTTGKPQGAWQAPQWTTGGVMHMILDHLAAGIGTFGSTITHTPNDVMARIQNDAQMSLQGALASQAGQEKALDFMQQNHINFQDYTKLQGILTGEQVKLGLGALAAHASSATQVAAADQLNAENDRDLGLKMMQFNAGLAMKQYEQQLEMRKEYTSAVKESPEELDADVTLNKGLSHIPDVADKLQTYGVGDVVSNEFAKKLAGLGGPQIDTAMNEVKPYLRDMVEGTLAGEQGRRPSSTDVDARLKAYGLDSPTPELFKQNLPKLITDLNQAKTSKQKRDQAKAENFISGMRGEIPANSFQNNYGRESLGSFGEVPRTVKKE